MLFRFEKVGKVAKPIIWFSKATKIDWIVKGIFTVLGIAAKITKNKIDDIVVPMLQKVVEKIVEKFKGGKNGN